MTAVHDGENIQARAAMLRGACLAGQAFANAPVAAIHALAYPLGGIFHIPHGLSNALLLPHVLRFNAPKAASLYAELAPIIMPNYEIKTQSAEDVTEALSVYFERLIVNLGLPNTLTKMNIKESDLLRLAFDAMKQTRLLMNNPRDVSEFDALTIYQTALV